ncbi:SAICAR synthase-like protein, partial [Rhizodiscina lignyota]
TTTDGSLTVPASTSIHRASSPPAFQHQTPRSLTPTSTSQSQPQPPRLQQRHTLEVPRVSTSRLSREMTNATQADGEVVSATGRFSPNTPTRRRGSMSLVRRATRSIASDLHLDEVLPDDDAARWAEHIRQKRASKRKRKDDEDDDRVVVGTKVDQNHVNWVTAYNMLTGIRFTVSRTNAKLDRDLTDADFEAKHKFSFDITGNELTPSAKYDFKFKDYAPWVFRHLRATFKLDPADYLMSLTSKYILSELGSPGKSGSFFYFSRDYKYIIKTIHHAEHKFLRKILREYYNHVQENPNTLLSQFYGLHRVKIPYGRKIHFVVMNNLFPPHRDIHRTFDLKGSTIGRDFKEDDLEKNPRATLKDLNWLRRNLHLEFGPTKKKAFIEQMERDVHLLQRLKIMDYSLLVGIHDLERGNEDKLRDKTLKVFQPGGEDAEEEVEQRMSNVLTRTPSKLENARKAKELRHMIKTQRPIPMEQAKSGMPDELEEEGTKKGFYFYSDDGGFRATHENDLPGEEIYYLGIIDCLTHYGFIKRAEHFWKGLSSPESQISAVPPERYGDRFVRFINGITKTREAAELEK